MGSGGAMSSGGAGGMGGIPSTGGATPTGGVMGPGTGGVAPTGGTAGGGANGAAGGRGGSSSGGMAGNGGRPGGTGGSAGAPGPSCFTDSNLPCTCADYCRTIETKCASSMFYPPNECVPTCQGFGWPEALISDTTSGLSCRSSYLLFSTSYCRTAGPTGYMACSSSPPCPLFCLTVANNCKAGRYPYQPDPEGDDCLAKCSSYAFEAGQRVMPMSTIGGGNDGNCRLYWAAYAGRMGLTESQRDDACANTAMLSAACP